MSKVENMNGSASENMEGRDTDGPHQVSHPVDPLIIPVNDNTPTLKKLFSAVNKAVHSKADYVFPISAISGAALISYAGSSNDNALLFSGGIAAALSNTFLTAATAVRSQLSEKYQDMKPATLTMFGLTGAGLCYIASGVNAPDILADPLNVDVLKVAVLNMKFPEVAMGVFVSGTAISKLCGAEKMAKLFASGVPFTLVYNAADQWGQTGDWNIPLLLSAGLYGCAAYTVGSVGQKQPAHSPEIK